MSHLNVLFSILLFSLSVVAGGIVYWVSKNIFYIEYSLVISILSGMVVGLICSKVAKITNAN